MSTSSEGLICRLGAAEREATYGHPVLRILLLQTPMLLLLAGIALVSFSFGVPMSAFTRDPAAIAGINPLNGFLSSLGTMLWSATVAVCLFSALVVRRRHRSNTRWADFFQYFGLLTLALLLDDLFLIHDEIVPAVFSVAEKPVYCLYGSALLYGIYRYWRQLRLHREHLFFIAVLFFGVSVGLDVFAGEVGNWEFWIEDGAKVLGILNWCAFFTSLALYVVLHRSELPETSA